MENKQNLVRQPSDLSVAKPTSWTESEKTLAVEMHLCSLNSKSEPESELAAEFSRTFSVENPEAIQSAFRAWREVSPFFPTISEIRDLVQTWHRVKKRELEQQREAEEKQAIRDARARGELIDFADIKDMVRKIAEKAGPVPTIAEMAKSIPEIPAHEFPPKAELERRRNEQLEKVRARFGDRNGTEAK